MKAKTKKGVAREHDNTESENLFKVPRQYLTVTVDPHSSREQRRKVGHILQIFRYLEVFTAFPATLSAFPPSVWFLFLWFCRHSQIH